MLDENKLQELSVDKVNHLYGNNSDRKWLDTECVCWKEGFKEAYIKARRCFCLSCGKYAQCIQEVDNNGRTVTCDKLDNFITELDKF